MAPIKLLHIEDNEDYRDLLAATLRVEPPSPFFLASVGSLREGIDKLEGVDGPFDLVLLDWSLPDASGVESIGTIREVDQKLGIVVFTGHDEDAVVEAAGKSGADGFLLKGANVRTVLTTLHFAACKRHNGDDLVKALEAMISGMEAATGSIEERVASEENNDK